MIGTALNVTHPRCWPAYRKLLQSTDWPILVGPWHSELGFEALYWIPFVQALGIAPDRIVPITRGGIGPLYGAPRSVELYAMRDPKAVRIENILQAQQTGLQKQIRITAFDRVILQEAADALNLTRYHVLHPAWMYRTLAAYWGGTRGLDWLWPHLMRKERTDKGQQFTKKVLGAPQYDIPGLPPQFVAVRFYMRSTLPYSEATTLAATETVKQIASHMPVVLLDSPIHADEHMDFKIPAMANVIRLSQLGELTPQNNLAVQACVLSRAQGFVGTYGGLSQLALQLGKPSISFYWSWHSTALAHKYLADAVASATNLSYLVLRISEVPLLRSMLPALQMTAQRSSRVTEEPFIPRSQPAEQTA